MNIKVLWNDDQYRLLTPFINDARLSNIELDPVGSDEELLEVLRNNRDKYDAILLDAVTFAKKTDTPGTESDEGFLRLMDEIRSLDATLPIFVLTGNPDLFKSSMIKGKIPKIYEKGDYGSLFSDIETAVLFRPQTAIRQRYPTIFEACTPAYFGDSAAQTLMQIFLKLKDNPSNVYTRGDFNALRKIYEGIVGKLSQLNIVPSEISLNGSSGFFAGNSQRKDVRGSTQKFHWKGSGSPFHQAISKVAEQFLAITQDASHNTPKLKYNFDDYVSQFPRPHLMLACLNYLLELIEYFKKYIDDNPNSAVNGAKWELR